MAARFERVAGPYEGPAAGLVWDGVGMLFSILSRGPRAGEGRILRFDPKTGRTDPWRNFTNRTSGIAFGRDGELYGCQELSRRIVRFNSDGSTSLTATFLAGGPHNLPTSLAIDSRGRIWFSDARSALRTSGPQIYPLTEPDSVLRLELEKTHWVLRRMSDAVDSPHAVALAPDEKTLYVADRRGLHGFPVHEDALGAPRSLFAAGGAIAGLCIKDDGDLLACAGRKIHVLSPSGQSRESLAFPGEAVNCAFGDGDLYVTTAAGELWRRRP